MMKNNQSESVISRSLDAQFHGAHFLCRSQMSADFSKLFFHSGSMTKMLKDLSKERLVLKVLDHSWQKPRASESKILRVDSAWGIGREVLMSGAGKPWLYGRTFFPESVIKAHGNDFLFLGARPLGEILFSNPQVSRSDFTVAQLVAGHTEYQKAVAAFESSPDYLWARRSEFLLPSGTITLLEVFSPQLEDATQSKRSKK